MERDRECTKCRLLEWCPGTCDEMDAMVENNKLTVEHEDTVWATA